MLTKMKAVKYIDEMDGKFAKGETFRVNDERRFFLLRTEQAVVEVDQSPEEPAVPDVATVLVAPATVDE